MSTPSLVAPSLRNLKRILVVHARGGLGDVLLSTPVLDALKRRYPDVPIDMLVRKGAAPLVQHHPALDDVLAVPEGDLDRAPTWRQWLRTVKKRGYSLGIVLWSKAPEAWLLYRGGVRHRVGQDSRLMYSWTYTRRVSVRSERGDQRSHWVDCLLDYARAVGGDVETPEPRFVLPVSAHSEACEVLRSHGVDPAAPLVVLSPGRGTPLTPERLPIAPFARMADTLGKHFSAPVLLTGTESERGVLEAIAASSQVRCLSLAGTLNLHQLGALFGLATVVVANDSGPMHIAAAVKAPTVGIFAMEKDHPQRWGPWGEGCEVVRPESFACAPSCLKETCARMACYEQVDAAAVLAAALRCVAARKGSP